MRRLATKKKDHRLLWLNIIIGNIKNNITGIYHGITKREMPLFLNEQSIDLTIERWERLSWIKSRNTYRDHFLSVIDK